MKVLVVGASGFIGSVLSHGLDQRGHEVHTSSSVGTTVGSLDLADVANCTSTLNLGRYDAVVNLAGRGATNGSANSLEMFRVNWFAAETLSLALTRLEVPPPYLVHVSSSTEPRANEFPESIYSKSKALGSASVQRILGNAALPFSIARVHNTYGPTQPEGRFIMSTIRRLQLNEQVEIVHPLRVRDFCLIDDVALRLIDLIEGGEENPQSVEVGTGIGVTLKEVAGMIATELGAPETLIKVQDGLEQDEHLVTVADSGLATFRRCTTSIEKGISSTIRSLR